MDQPANTIVSEQSYIKLHKGEIVLEKFHLETESQFKARESPAINLRKLKMYEIHSKAYFTSIEAELCGQQGQNVGLVVALHPAAPGDRGGAGLGDPGGAAVAREGVTSQLKPRDGGETGSEEVSNTCHHGDTDHVPDVLQNCQVIVAQVE